jgi:hypothetical protein
MASSLGSLRSAVGSILGPVVQSATFTDLRRAVQIQADALVAPSDTPICDLERMVEDATGNRVLWSYRLSTNAWKGVQVA